MSRASGADAVVRRSIAQQMERQNELAGEIHDLRVQLARLGQAPNWYEEGLRRDTNLELLKAEVRSLERSVLELGMQLAPATGLAGVGARMGELREQVNAVSRRTQQIDQAVRQLGAGGATATSTAATSATATPTTPPRRTTVTEPRPRWEPLKPRRWTSSSTTSPSSAGSGAAPRRSSPSRASATPTCWPTHAPVLDWGCGRGELLELLQSRGVDVVGVEIDAGMVSEARSRGLTVHQVDAVSYMSTCEPESLGAVFSAHVAEHIPFDALLEVVHASLRALRPGGVFVAETPNPTSLVVPSNSFILDPTHLRPIHPSLFAFACETAGFRDVRLTFYSPADRLPRPHARRGRHRPHQPAQLGHRPPQRGAVRSTGVRHRGYQGRAGRLRAPHATLPETAGRVPSRRLPYDGVLGVQRPRGYL